MYSLIPPTGFVRISTILKYVPVSRSTWWAGCKSGRFPKPIKLGHRTTVWKAEEIHNLIKELGQSSGLQNEQENN